MAFDTANFRNEQRSSITCSRVHLTRFSGHKVLIDYVCQAFDMNCGGMSLLELFKANITMRVRRLTLQTAATRAHIVQ